MSNSQYEPPIKLTETVINLVADICEMVGRLSVDYEANVNPRLRRDSRIKTIHASLAIENNSLSIEQVTDVINGKKVFGPPSEIQEVKNAFEAYEKLLGFNQYSSADLLIAHKLLMHDLVKEAGRFRSGGVGVFAGEKLVHMAPPAEFVPEQIEMLLDWAKTSTLHPLIKSCVFHYEFEFIHPFQDGNGRMGRMWQTLILYNWNPSFAWIPVETIIRENQSEYYDALGKADKAADSSIFVEFLLSAIRQALTELSVTAQATAQVTAQVELLLEALDDGDLSLQQLMEKMNLHHRQSFRSIYLLPAIEAGVVEMTIPDKPNSSKQKYRRK